LKLRLAGLSAQLAEVRSAYEGLQGRVSDPTLIERFRLLDQQEFEKRRLQERLDVISAKLEAYVTSSGGVLTKDIQDELAIYKVMADTVRVATYLCFLETDEMQFVSHSREKCRPY